jgi:CheY-like chemotaxis protein
VREAGHAPRGPVTGGLTPERTAEEGGSTAHLRHLIAQTALLELVPDEDALREVTHRILAGRGYRVIPAMNGTEALAAAAERPGAVDLLLSDVIMPHMNGAQLAKQIQREQPSIRVMFMSGFAQSILDSGDRLDAGVVLIEKPFTGPSLLASVGQVLKDETVST